MSRDMRKPDFRICENKATDQLCSNWSVYVHSTNSNTPPLKRTKTMPKFHLAKTPGGKFCQKMLSAYGKVQEKIT